MSIDLGPNTGDADIAGQKRRLRAQLNARRRQLTEAEQQKACLDAADRLVGLPAWDAAQVIASYFANAGELDPSRIDERARRAGKRVVYPRITGPGEMCFVQWQPGEPRHTNRYGIDEPAEGDPIPLETIDFFVVPLVACDSHGQRLGYGGGFYDRLLEKTSAFSCGIGYTWQLLPTLPNERHDQPLDAFLSDGGLTLFD